MTLVEINESTKEGKAILEVLDLLPKGNDRSFGTTIKGGFAFIEG